MGTASVRLFSGDRHTRGERGGEARLPEVVASSPCPRTQADRQAHAASTSAPPPPHSATKRETRSVRHAHVRHAGQAVRESAAIRRHRRHAVRRLPTAVNDDLRTRGGSVVVGRWRAGEGGRVVRRRRKSRGEGSPVTRRKHTHASSVMQRRGREHPGARDTSRSCHASELHRQVARVDVRLHCAQPTRNPVGRRRRGARTRASGASPRRNFATCAAWNPAYSAMLSRHVWLHPCGGMGGVYGGGTRVVQQRSAPPVARPVARPSQAQRAAASSSARARATRRTSRGNASCRCSSASAGVMLSTAALTSKNMPAGSPGVGVVAGVADGGSGDTVSAGVPEGVGGTEPVEEWLRRTRWGMERSGRRGTGGSGGGGSLDVGPAVLGASGAATDGDGAAGEFDCDGSGAALVGEGTPVVE